MNVITKVVLIIKVKLIGGNIHDDAIKIKKKFPLGKELQIHNDTERDQFICSLKSSMWVHNSGCL